MNRRRFLWWPLHRGKRYAFREPGAVLFSGLRTSLTLWYCGVLGTALLLFSVILYFGAQIFLLNPIETDTAVHAHAHVDQWLASWPDPTRACSSFGPSGRFGAPAGPRFMMPEMVACFDSNGSLLQYPDTAQFPSAFLSNGVAKTALQEGEASDVVDGGGTVGQIYRYAVAVQNPTGKGYVSVVVTGEPIQAQETALSLLLTLLLTVGGVTLLGAGLGGLFLANRALAPARLAWANQQRFIADAAHELRTPLTLLRADAEVLLRGREQLTTEDAVLLEDIVAEANHMATLANSMLTLARLDNGAVHREHEVVHLAELAQEGARRVQALADQKGIHVQVENTGWTSEPERTGSLGSFHQDKGYNPGPLPYRDAPYVIGDPMLLEQAVLVLLDNAIKYNRQGGLVTVRTAVKDEHALLEVSDTGVGIAAEHLPHLGERFYRVDKARSREAGGTGLGLSIARSIADVHGGTLRLSSIPEQGTTATLLLPLARGTSSHNIHDAPAIISSLPE